MDPLQVLVAIITGQDLGGSITFTAEQLRNLALASVMVPRVVDIVRTGLYNIVLRIKETNPNFFIEPNTIAGSQFGFAITLFITFGYGLIFAASFNLLQPGQVFANMATAFIISQFIYKTGKYESSTERKIIVTTVDKIGPQVDEKDSEEELKQVSDPVTFKDVIKESQGLG
jgi:hypothetical protein